jgi:ribosome biogenesis protein ERB1
LLADSAGLDAVIAATNRPSHSKNPTALSTAADVVETNEGAEQHETSEPVSSRSKLDTIRESTSEDDSAAEPDLRDRKASRKLASTSLLRDDDFLRDPGSDSSEDERPPRNTIGNVPLEWYKDEQHIGYDRCGPNTAASFTFMHFASTQRCLVT